MGDERSVLAVYAQTRMQSTQAAQCQIGVERRARNARTVRPPDQTLVQFRRRCDDGTADDVAVPVEIFSGRVQYEVCAERDWPLPRWRQERVVDEHQRARCMRLLSECANVDDPQQRIAGRLDPDQLRTKRERRCKGAVVGLIDELHAHDAALRQVAEQAIRPAVTVVRRYQQVVCREELHDKVNSRHAGGRNDSPSPAFERCKRFGERIARRVAGTRVVVRSLLAERLEGERRGQVNRRDDSTVLSVRLEGRAHCASGSRKLVTHDAPPCPDSARSKTGSRAAPSLRNASWPYSDESSTSDASPPSRACNERRSEIGMS